MSSVAAEPAARGPVAVEHEIASYGLLGDTRTAALVAPDGSIDWMCAPRFDADPFFGSLVGGPEAGRFRVGPAEPAAVHTRAYRDASATLETTWLTEQGRVTLSEGMVSELDAKLLPRTLLVRRVVAHDAPVDVAIELDPRRGERREPPHGEANERVVICRWTGAAMALACHPPVLVVPGVRTIVTVEPRRPFVAALAFADREPLVLVPPLDAWRALQADERGWREWCTDLPDDIPQRDAVVRSAITLRLLTHSPSGAPVAAPTTSLPERVGGARNWDYRYAWPRDASIGIGAFLGLGKRVEAERFMAWLLHASRLDRPRLRALFSLYGGRVPPERTLESWPGYRGSRPVRVGNEARHQHQLDVYGWVLDAGWLLAQSTGGLNAETWRALRAFADEVAARWHEPDAGIWEVRGALRHYVHSKLMAWLALDRALRIADTHVVSKRRRERWQTARAELTDALSSHALDAAADRYPRTCGSDDVDAALLVLPLIGVDNAQSTRVRNTIDTIRARLGAGGPLLYRYSPGTDGLPGKEGAFLACSFWLAQALAKSGRIEEANDVFSDTVALASPLGLFAEEMDPVTHEHLGNFPQALSHAGLLQAALALRDATRP